MNTSFKLCILPMLISAAFPTWAAEPDKGTELENVKVIGTRQPPQKLGERRTTRRMMDEHMVQDMRDMVRYDPAVTVVEGGRGSSNGFTIRGVDKDRVAITIDGLAQAESRSSEGFQELFGAYGNYNANRNANELENISEVTIRKGADSLTSGSGALGGAVAYQTKSPRDVVDADKPYYFAVKGGRASRDNSTFGSVDAAGYLKGFDARFVFTKRSGHEVKNKNDGSVKEYRNTRREGLFDPSRANNHISDWGSFGKMRAFADPQEYTSKSTLLKLGYHFNEQHYLNWMYEDYRMDRETEELSNLFAADFTGSPLTTQRNRNDVSYIKRTGVQYEHTANSGLWDKLTLTYNRQNIQMSTMTWDLPNDFAQQGMNAQVYYSLRRIVQRTQQIDARAEKSIDLGRWKWNMNYGLGWSKATNENDNYTRWVRAYNTRVTTSALNAEELFMEAESRKRHVYWNNQFQLGDSLRLAVGARHDWIHNRTLPSEKVITSMRQAGLENASPKFSATSYSLGIDWKFLPNWTVMAKWSTAFRAPTTDEMWFNFPHPDFTVEANPNLKAETARNLELGISGKGRLGNIMLSGFKTDYDNFIDFAYIGVKQSSYYNPATGATQARDYHAPTWKNVNRDAAQIKGLELSGEWKMDSIGLPKGMVTTFTASYLKGHSVQETGRKTPINALAPFSAVLGVGYTRPGGDWGIKANLSYTQRKRPSETVHSYEDLDNPWPYAKYGRNYYVLDLIGHYRIGKHFTIRAGVFNVLDKQYYTWDSLRSIREFGMVNRIDNSTGAGIQRFSAPGRNYMLNLEAKW